MHDAVTSLGAVAILVAGVALGYQRWIRPRAQGLGLAGKGLLLLLTLVFIGGLIGPFFWWPGARPSFPWRLPPLAGRMLASAGWAFAIVTFAALERPSRRRVRLVLILLATYLAPLVVVICLFHLNRFDFSASITYGFFLIAAGTTLAALWFLWHQPEIDRDPAGDTPAGPVVQLWLGLLTVVLGLWGLALFVTDRGPSPLVWVWPGDLLTSRLIAVMLLTLAVGAAALRYIETAGLMLLMTAAYGLGVALAAFWNSFAGKPVPTSYLVSFSVILLISAIFLGARVQSAGRPKVQPKGA